MHPYASQIGANRAQQAAQALTSALANPYQHSSHYAQAYYSHQTSANMPMRTPEGYSLSSAYVPSLPAGPQLSFARRGSGRGSHSLQQSRGGGNNFHTQRGQQQQTHWYEPGDHRCTHEQCTFIGSKGSLETHMMDRHLVFPPGWDKRKRKRDWDADPSLKNGKPIPIQGTSVVLDTPEAVDAWIAERKRRWPSALRVEEKNSKLKDAIERGEIAANDPSLRGRKRSRIDDSLRGRGQARGRGRGHGAGRGGAQVQHTAMVHALPMKPATTITVKADESDDGTSSSGSDVDPERDAISSKPPPGVVDAVMEEDVLPEVKKDEAPKDVPPEPIKPVFRQPSTQPKVTPKHHFTNRPSLLRNLLLPEIRMTVSNLSQAIHFLVENDFLRDVELNPGDSDNKPIEVIGETSHEFA